MAQILGSTDKGRRENSVVKLSDKLQFEMFFKHTTSVIPRSKTTRNLNDFQEILRLWFRMTFGGEIDIYNSSINLISLSKIINFP